MTIFFLFICAIGTWVYVCNVYTRSFRFFESENRSVILFDLFFFYFSITSIFWCDVYICIIHFCLLMPTIIISHCYAVWFEEKTFSLRFHDEWAQKMIRCNKIKCYPMFHISSSSFRVIIKSLSIQLFLWQYSLVIKNTYII